MSHPGLRLGHGWIEFAVRRDEAAKCVAIQALVDATANADAFDPASLELLSHRDCYPMAVRILDRTLRTKKWHSDRLLPVIYDRPSFSILIDRLATHFHVVGSYEHVDLDFLRALAPEVENPKSNAARIVLAIIGECDWPSADRKTRLAFVLGALVRHRMGMASP